MACAIDLGGARVIVLVLVAVGVMLVACAPAFAAQTRKLVSTFGSLSDPRGLAIDQSGGDVYVADAGGNRIEKFDSKGNFLLAFGRDVGGRGVDTCALSCGPGTAGRGPGQFTMAQFVAVDDDPASASFRDVYVADTGDNLVSKFDSFGKLISSWGSGGQLDGSTTGWPAKTFGTLAGIAVDAAGTLLVFNIERQLFKFAQNGVFQGELQAGEGAAGAGGLGVDGEGNLFRGNEDSSVQELHPDGSNVGDITFGLSASPPVGVTAFAVDAKGGGLYVVSEQRTLDHFAFSGPAEVIEPDGTTCVGAELGCNPSDSVPIPFVGGGVAANSETGDVYVSNPVSGEIFEYAPATIPDVSTAAASEVRPTGVTLNGTVNADGIALSDCHFEYGTSEAYGQSAPCVPVAGSIPPDSSPHAVRADVSGLRAGATYHYRLVAGNENGTNRGRDETASTPPPPSIGEAVARDLTETTANLTAKIDPRGFETRVHFEYDTVAYLAGEPANAHGKSEPLATIPAGNGDVPVAQGITGLSAHPTTTYHWRVVAESVNGVTIGPDQTFVYDTSGEGLPENRAYEMVTPSRKNGALLGGAITSVQISSDGSRVVGKSIQCFAGAALCDAQRAFALGNPYEFARTPAGWVTTPLDAPVSRFSNFAPWQSSAEAGTELFSSPTEPFGEDDLYGRQADGTIIHIGPYTPPQLGPLAASPSQWVVSPNLSHVLWDVRGAGEKWAFDKTRESESSVYEYAASDNTQPFLVGVSGEGNPGSSDLISVCGTTLPEHEGVGTMSADGRIVYFQANGGQGCVGAGSNAGVPVPANALYARVDGELPDAHTVAISAPSPDACTGSCLTSPPAAADFAGASSDGSKAFFLSTRRLTNQASEDGASKDTAAAFGCPQTTGENGCNLYMYDFTRPVGDRTVAISEGDSSGHGPRVRGVVAISQDGSHVYFVAQGVLTQVANAQGQAAQDGANNLYVYERGASGSAGQLRFIATLPSSDKVMWGFGAVHSADVTPAGGYLVFTSHGGLTADDSSVSGARQVFRYDAQTGELLRISTGENGFDNNGNRTVPNTCGANHCPEDATIATLSSPTERRDLTMSDDGSRVFFQSSVALTPHALDDVRVGTTEGLPAYAQNVYEWHAGHVSLISDGRDTTADVDTNGECFSSSSVCLLGTDATGANVFFATADQLTAADTNSEVDYYDARVCEPERGNPCLAPPSSPPSACSGEACHGTPAATPVAPGAPTATFNGHGNVAAKGAGKPAHRSLTRARKLVRALKSCRGKRNKRKRATCERLAKKRYGPERKVRKSNMAKAGAKWRGGR